MGDCFFLASLAATAQTNPEFIEQNIWFSDGKYHVQGGGFAQDAMPTITGRPTRTADDEPSFDDLRSEFERGNVVVADTAPRGGDDGGWWDIVNNDDGPVPRDTVSRHQYVVRGFTEDGRIIMQNPWGPDGGYERDDDVFKPGQLVFTESEYRERFENVTITEDPDTSNPVQPAVVP